MTQNNDHVKLLPCPFCGKEARLTPIHCVMCSDEDGNCSLSVHNFQQMTPRQWNTRASIPAPAGGAERQNTEKGYPHALCAIEGCLRDSQDMGSAKTIAEDDRQSKGSRVNAVDGSSPSLPTQPQTTNQRGRS